MTICRATDLTIERSAKRPMAAPTKPAATTPIETEIAEHLAAWEQWGLEIEEG